MSEQGGAKCPRCSGTARLVALPELGLMAMFECPTHGTFRADGYEVARAVSYSRGELETGGRAMSEAKVCEVCGHEDCGIARFGPGASLMGAYEHYRLGYERERAAREKAEAERDAAIEARESAMDDTAVALRQAKNAEADLAQARKERDDARKGLDEARRLVSKASSAWNARLTKAEAARDSAIRLLREAHECFVVGLSGIKLNRNTIEAKARINAFLRAHDSAATGDTPSDPAAAGCVPTYDNPNPDGRRACPHTPTCRELWPDAKCFRYESGSAPVPEPAGRSEDEAEALALSLGLADRLPQKYHRADGTVVDASGNPWRSTLVEQIRAALAAAERRGMERAADGCDHYAETAKVAGDPAAAAVATLLARSIRVRAAEPEKAS